MSAKQRRRKRQAGRPGRREAGETSTGTSVVGGAAQAGGANPAPGSGSSPRPSGSGKRRTAKSGPAEPGARAPLSLLRNPIVLAAASVLAIAAAALLVLGRRGGGFEVRRAAGLNVLLVTLDTTRADRIGCYGYPAARTPNLDALASGGVRFANAYTSVPLTLPSHASILTGQTPPVHGVRNNGAYVLDRARITLAELLKQRGYATAAFVASFSVDSRFGLDQGFDVYDDDFQAGAPFKALNAERRAEQVYEEFAAWVDESPPQPFLGWVHFFDPHLPYSPPEPYSEQLENPYDGEIAYMDFMLGRVLRKLRDRGVLERTLVVIAGDHGEGFGEKGESGHGVFVYDETLRVPLLLMAESRLPAGRVVDARVRLIDVLPTVLDLLDLPAPEAVEGVSLLSRIERRRSPDLDTYVETLYPRENFGWAPLTGWISGPWKYVHAPRAELYDLAGDPREERNRAADRESVATRLRSGLESYLAGAGAAGGTGTGGREMTAADEARLRSLGYVNYREAGGSADAPADPKDKLDELKMVQDAEAAEFGGDFAAAASLHEKTLALRPGAASSYVNLALSKARLKDFDGAIATLKQGLDVLPGNELILTRLGYTYLVTGRTEEALTVMGEVLEGNPLSVDALTATAAVLDQLDRKDEARGFFERALAEEPESKFLRSAYAGNLVSTGRLAEGIAVYVTLTEDYPADMGLRRALGIAYGRAGDLDQALESFQTIVYTRPDPDAYFNLALVYREKGETAEAVRYFEKFLEQAAAAGEPQAKIDLARAEVRRLSGSR